jgi:prepilin-type N-terminal cleavage/methylation domain-containing protein
MHPCPIIRRAGMTLVELLVVVAIIGLLAVTVLPSLANTTEGRRTRETTRMLTSFIAQSQAKALGQSAGVGFGIIKTGTGAADPALDLVPAIIPEAYRGDTPSATATLQAPPSYLLTFIGSFGSGMSCTTGDLIRFDGRGSWYGLAALGSGTYCSLRSTAAVDALAGQTDRNTPWPAFNVPHTFEILRSPQRAGGVVSVGEGRCIDTFWSFAGTTQLNFNLPPLTAATPSPPPIYVIFDSAGGVRQVVAGSNRFSPDGPILLLVGRADRAGQSWTTLNSADDTVGANWQYADSEWVAIDMLTGVAKSAPCATGAANSANTVAGSMAYIKASLIAGVR